MSVETGVTRQQILGELYKSVHGDLRSYIPVISEAAKAEGEFLSHLVAYDFVNGQMKDPKIALPVITLGTSEFPDALVENSLAHLCLQPPRELLKALLFAFKQNHLPARRKRLLESVVRRYLRHKEAIPQKWAHLAASQRKALKGLYKISHSGAPEWVSTALFGDWHKEKRAYPHGSIFADISNLAQMPPNVVAATIQKWHLSPLVVSGAMAGSKTKLKDSGVVQATMDQMSDTQLINNAASLERKGAAKDGALKSTFRKKVARAVKGNKATLKTSVAAAQVEDEGMRELLHELQERQIAAQKAAGKGIEGDWIVIVDRSISQDVAIKIGIHIGAALSKFVTNKVWLVFCNTEPTPMEVTGKTLEQINGQAQFMFAAGGTSYGVALAWAQEKGLRFDGAVVVGDGGENSLPLYPQAYLEYEKFVGKKIPTYFFQTYCDPKYRSFGSNGHPDQFANTMRRAGLTFTANDITSGAVDFYAIPGMVAGISANKFGLVEKILACPLLTLNQVF